MKALLIFFTYVLISGVVYSQGGTAIDRYQQYANYFEEYLPLGLDNSSIEKKYLEGKKQNASDTLAIFNVKQAEIAFLKAVSFSKCKLARKEGQAELMDLLKTKTVISDSDIFSILDRQYHRFIDGLNNDYLAMVKLKTGSR